MTLAYYVDLSYVHEKYHFHSKLRQRKSISLLLYVASRTAECRAAPIFRLYWLRDVTINDKQRLTKRYKQLV